MPRRWIGIGVCGLVLLGVVGVWAVGTLVAGPDVPVYELELGRFLNRIEAEGVLVAEQATELTAPMTIAQGKAPAKIAWLAEDGTRVAAGEVVVRFDPTEMEQELFGGEIDRSRTDQQVTQRELEQETALENLGRDAELADLQLRHASEFQSTDDEIFSQREILESEIDRTLATHRKEHTGDVRSIRENLGAVELDLLELQRRQAQLQIDRAQAGLQALEVRAPHDGIFVLRRDRRGEIPTIGQIAWPGMTLAEIPQLDAMKATVYVLEADAGGLDAGISAEVRIEAHPGVPVNATVRRVANVAQRRTRWSPVQYFEVELALESTDVERMKPGQRVRATLELADEESVLAMPREAVFRDEAGEPQAFVWAGTGFEARAITIGNAALGRVVVTGGLSAGDTVALEDPTRDLVGTDGEAEGSTPAGFPTGGNR